MEFLSKKFVAQLQGERSLSSRVSPRTQRRSRSSEKTRGRAWEQKGAVTSRPSHSPK